MSKLKLHILTTFMLALIISLSLCGCRSIARIKEYSFDDVDETSITIEGVRYLNETNEAFVNVLNGWHAPSGMQKCVGRLSSDYRELYFNRNDLQHIYLRIHLYDPIYASMVATEAVYLRQDIMLPEFCKENIDWISIQPRAKGKAAESLILSLLIPYLSETTVSDVSMVNTVCGLYFDGDPNVTKDLYQAPTEIIATVYFHNKVADEAGCSMYALIFSRNGKYYIEAKNGYYSIIENELLEQILS